MALVVIFTLIISVIITFHIFSIISHRTEIKAKEREQEFLDRYQTIYRVKDREEDMYDIHR